MRDNDRPVEDRLVRLDLYVDRHPISGRLSTPQGPDEPFEGWLAFFEALSRLAGLGDQPDLTGSWRAGSDPREEDQR
jgi:hypothetical protein